VRATAAALTALFGTDASWAADIDQRIDALPGLAGLHLVRRSARKPGRRPIRIPLRGTLTRRAAPAHHGKDEAH
jgi:hypothetical protein